MREALESDIVSEQLHLWIDLIFGQQENSDLTFNPVSVEASYNWCLVDSEMEKSALEVQAREYGQCPTPIFFTEHPVRQFRRFPELYRPLESTEETLRIKEEITSLKSRFAA